jgi:hypothetical protein
MASVCLPLAKADLQLTAVDGHKEPMVLFLFQFCISSVEILSRHEENLISQNCAVVFQLFNFKPVSISLKNLYHTVSSRSKTFFRGGKSCHFKLTVSSLKVMGTMSSLKVMLVNMQEKGCPVAEAVAAGETRLKGFVDNLFAGEYFVKSKRVIDVFDSSNCLFARLKVKLSLGVLEGHPQNFEHDVYKLEIGQNATTFTPPPVVCVVNSANNEPSNHTDNPQSLDRAHGTVDCQTVTEGMDSQSHMVWPNGYIEELPTPHCADNTTKPPDREGLTYDEVGFVMGNSRYPLLEALCAELTVMRARSDGHHAEGEVTADVGSKVLHDKCLQTEDIVAAVATTSTAVDRKKKATAKSFTRSCCKQIQNDQPRHHVASQGHTISIKSNSQSKKVGHKDPPIPSNREVPLVPVKLKANSPMDIQVSSDANQLQRTSPPSCSLGKGPSPSKPHDIESLHVKPMSGSAHCNVTSSDEPEVHRTETTKSSQNVKLSHISLSEPSLVSRDRSSPSSNSSSKELNQNDEKALSKEGSLHQSLDSLEGPIHSQNSAVMYSSDFENVEESDPALTSEDDSFDSNTNNS